MSNSGGKGIKQLKQACLEFHFTCSFLAHCKQPNVCVCVCVRACVRACVRNIHKHVGLELGENGLKNKNDIITQW